MSTHEDRSASIIPAEPPYYNVLVEFPNGAKRIDRHHATIEWLKSELYYRERRSGNRYTILTDAQYDALVAEWALARRDAERDARRAA